MFNLLHFFFLTFMCLKKLLHLGGKILVLPHFLHEKRRKEGCELKLSTLSFEIIALSGFRSTDAHYIIINVIKDITNMCLK